MTIELFQPRHSLQVIGKQSPLACGSRMEQAAESGADVNCRGYASAAHGGSGKSSKDIELQPKCLRASWVNGAGSTRRHCQSNSRHASESGVALSVLDGLADRASGRWALHPVFHQFISIKVPRGHCVPRLINSLESLPGSFGAASPNHIPADDHQAVVCGAHHSRKDAAHCRSRTWHGPVLCTARRWNITSWLVGSLATPHGGCTSVSAGWERIRPYCIACFEASSSLTGLLAISVDRLLQHSLDVSSP